jgi:hypothetical protein
VQWMAIMLAVFLVIGLRRQMSTRTTVAAVVLTVAATLAVWFTQMKST